MEIDIETSIDLYKKVYLIRKAEEAIIRYYPEDEMKTPMHMSMGSEAISAGVCRALRPGDQVFGTYRSHALYLAKTMETDKFFAEMYGKITGMAQGKAGSMHLSAPACGLMAVSAVVASTIPIAVGAAFAKKTENNGNIAAVFFGDGAIDEGNFWESLNIACLMKLPVLFVCEDNKFAIHISAERRHGYSAITDVVNGFKCHVQRSESTDVEIIYRMAKNATEHILQAETPSFLHLQYCRYLEHVGISEDFYAGYRSKRDCGEWLWRDPVSLQRDRLLLCGLSENELRTFEKEILEQIQMSIEYAKKADYPGVQELYRGVLCE